MSDDLKTANVSATFKKGQRHYPANYHPVSLTCLCCTILEQVILSNVLKHLGENIVNCEDSVKLLGVTIDFKLDFDEHISNVCKKASRQLNVLKKKGGHLCKLGKLNV